MSMGQSTFVDVLLCPDEQEGEMEVEEGAGWEQSNHDGADSNRL